MWSSLKCQIPMLTWPSEIIRTSDEQPIVPANKTCCISLWKHYRKLNLKLNLEPTKEHVFDVGAATAQWFLHANFPYCHYEQVKTIVRFTFHIGVSIFWGYSNSWMKTTWKIHGWLGVARYGIPSSYAWTSGSNPPRLCRESKRSYWRKQSWLLKQRGFRSHIGDRRSSNCWARLQFWSLDFEM